MSQLTPGPSERNRTDPPFIGATKAVLKTVNASEVDASGQRAAVRS